MLKLKSQMMYAGILALMLTFTSCKNEFEDLVLDEQEQTIAANSAMASLIMRTSLSDGSFDNIVDGSSCFYIDFPYSVKIDGIELKIEDQEGYKALGKIFDSLRDSSDSMEQVDDVRELLEIVFPVTIVLADYSEITINNIEELMEYSKKCNEERCIGGECNEGGEDDDIECIDFVYPLNLLTFNVSFEQIESVTIENDSTLYTFFMNLEPGTLAGFDYPITMRLYDGTQVEVDSNAKLASLMEEAATSCDEDDDDGFPDDICSEADITNALNSGFWKITSSDHGDTSIDKIDFSDGNIHAYENGEIKDEGNWRIEDGALILADTSGPLAQYNGSWKVTECADDKLVLSNADSHVVVLERTTTPEPEAGCSEADITNALNSGFWKITSSDHGDTSIDKIDFSDGNIHAYENGEIKDEGNWRIEDGALMLADTSGPLAQYNGSWKVTECTDKKLVLSDADSHVVVLEKID